MDESKKNLEQLLVAAVIILAKQIKAEKLAKGVSSTSDYISEAAALIRQQQPQILELLR